MSTFMRLVQAPSLQPLARWGCLLDKDTYPSGLLQFAQILYHKWMIDWDQNLVTGPCDGFPGRLVASTWQVQVLMAPWQSGTTRVDSLSVEQALRGMKMRFVFSGIRSRSSLSCHTLLEVNWTTSNLLHFLSATPPQRHNSWSRSLKFLYESKSSSTN